MTRSSADEVEESGRYHYRHDHLIETTREQALDRLQEIKDTVYSEDRKILESSDHLVRRFLIANSGNVPQAVTKLIQSLQWVKKMRFRDIGDNYFPHEMWFVGGIFLYEEDLGGHPTIHLRLKFFQKIKELSDAVKHFFGYHLWKVDQIAGARGFTIVADFNGVHLSNYDLGMLMFIVEVKDYIPQGAHSIIAVDCPWFMRAAWNTLKYALPSERRDQMMLMSTADLGQVIDERNLPYFLGGSCQRIFMGDAVVPAGCPGAIAFGTSLGINKTVCEKIYKMYEPFVEEVKDSLKHFDRNNNSCYA
jgi:hypothetical protein